MKIESSDEFVWCFSAMVAVFLVVIAAFVYHTIDNTLDARQLCPQVQQVESAP